MFLEIPERKSRSDRVSSGTSWCKAKPAWRQGQGSLSADLSTPQSRLLWEGGPTGAARLLPTHTCENCDAHSAATPSQTPAESDGASQHGDRGTYHALHCAFLFFMWKLLPINQIDLTTRVLRSPRCHYSIILRVYWELSIAYNSLLVGLIRPKCH